MSDASQKRCGPTPLSDASQKRPPPQRFCEASLNGVFRGSSTNVRDERMSQPTLDRNRLLGTLAVRTDLVTPKALAAAVAEWEREPSRSLGQVLLAQGHLGEEELAHLEGLAKGHLRKAG